MEKTSIYDYLTEWFEQDGNNIPVSDLITNLNNLVTELSGSGLDEFKIFPLIEPSEGSCNGWVKQN